MAKAIMRQTARRCQPLTRLLGATKMKLKHLGLAAAGLLFSTVLAFAAGMWPDYPVVGSASYCAGTSNSATGTIIGLVTGCPNTVPAGPTIVTGNEQIPADTHLAGGAAPQTVLVPMASLNALPIQFVSVTAAVNAAPAVSAANNSGGVCYNSTLTITSANITLPLAPIDGQQYVVCSNFTITTLVVGAAAGATLSVTTPTVLTASTTVPQGYTFIYNAASTKWFKLR